MQFGKGTYRIGEIAARTGLTPDALRYYERLGLLSRLPRTVGGFRIYTTDTLERVSFIKQAQTIGLSLDQIRELVRCLGGDTGQQPSDVEQPSDVTAAVVARLMQVDAKLGELRELRRTLNGYLKRRVGSPERHECGATQ